MLAGKHISISGVWVHGHNQSKIIIYSDLDSGLSNNNPVYSARRFFEYLYECKTLPDYIRIDKGLEKTIMQQCRRFFQIKG